MAIVFQILICGFSMALALSMVLLIALNGKKTDLRIKCILYILCSFIWCSGEFMQTLFFININYKWTTGQSVSYVLKLINYYKSLAVYNQSPIWLLFCFSFSYKTLSSVEKKIYKHKWLLLIPGLICLGLLATNESHGLLYYWINEKGRWVIYFGWVSRIHAVKDVVFYLWGVLTLLRHIRRRYPYYKKQWFIIMISAFVPHIIGNIYYMSGLYQMNNNFDLVPSLLLITLLFFNFAIFKYRFLNITPVAFPKMADELRESILIIDADGIIAYFNRAFKENFSRSCPISVDNEASCFTEYLRKNTNMEEKTRQLINAFETGSGINADGEIDLYTCGKYYTISIQPLYVRSNFIGQIITFYDVTEYKKLLLEVESKNRELELANIQLKEHSDAVEELAVSKERNRLAGDVHDSVAHTMTVLISLIGVCSLACDKDVGTVKQKLDEMMEAALKGHNELKRSVQGIMPENQGCYGIIQGLHSLIDDFEKTGVTVDFSVYGHESSKALYHRNTVYRICQEALTNSLRHGKASCVNIILRLSNEAISLHIFDDGIGCKVIKKNMGLNYMGKRVLELGGKISFGSDGEKGFNINVEIPLKQIADYKQIEP